MAWQRSCARTLRPQCLVEQHFLFTFSVDRSFEGPDELLGNLSPGEGAQEGAALHLSVMPRKHRELDSLQLSVLESNLPRRVREPPDYDLCRGLQHQEFA